MNFLQNSLVRLGKFLKEQQMAKQFNFEGTLFEQPTDFKNKNP